MEKFSEKDDCRELTLVATVGPACQSVDGIKAIKEAGANAIRINASHVDAAQLEESIGIILAAGFKREEVWVDLQGGKTRLDLQLAQPIHSGQRVQFVAGTAGVRVSIDSEEPAIAVDRAGFLQGVFPGDSLAIDDGRFHFRVLGLRTGPGGTQIVLAESQSEGVLLDRKGICVVGRSQPHDARLVEKDLLAIGAAVHCGVGAFAVSYARQRELFEAVRIAATGAGQSQEVSSAIRIAAKAETSDCLSYTEDYTQGADVVWICRGDLGAEVGLARLPVYQNRLLAHLLGKVPVLVAGQVLHHMTVSPIPTRSEVCHVADLVGRGVCGFVLSDETAIHPHGVQAIDILEQVCRAAVAEPPPYK